MLAGGALYVREADRHPATALRVASAGGYRPATTGLRAASAAGGVLGADGAPSLYDLLSELRTGSVPPATAPTVAPTTVPASRVAVGRASAATPAATVAPTPMPAAATSPSPGMPTTTTTPLTPLLQTIAPTAAAVLGAASWFEAPAGTCAHRDLPLGTIVKVTRTSTGVSTTCRVSDRGPALATNRVIDLSQATFAQLASTDAGVIEVKIEW